MLVQFSAENFRSIKNEVTLSLLSAAKNKHLDNSFSVVIEGKKTVDLLPSAAIYGPNASGKSNLFKALRSMQFIILKSADLLGQLPYQPFLLSKESLSAPTRFEVTLIIDETKYQYGFVHNQSKILAEWLYAGGKTLFTREINADNNGYAYQDRNLKGAKSTWKDSTRPDALFLSVAVRLNSSQLTPIYEWFQKKLHILNSADLSFTTDNYSTTDKKHYLLDFLAAADLDIEDVLAQSKDIEDPSLAPAGLSDLIAAINSRSNIKFKHYDIKFKHATDYNDGVDFDLQDESDGTQRMYNLAGPWLKSLEDGHVVFFDELNNSLHPFLVKFLVNKFNLASSNPKHGQLIFSTHETSLLDQKFMGRDQVWFCEKDNSRSTKLTSLIEYKHRSDILSIEKAYLSGRYNAVPFIDDEL